MDAFKEEPATASPLVGLDKAFPEK
jgi:hypothetical protein